MSLSRIRISRISTKYEDIWNSSRSNSGEYSSVQDSNAQTRHGQQRRNDMRERWTEIRSQDERQNANQGDRKTVQCAICSSHCSRSGSPVAPIVNAGH